MESPQGGYEARALAHSIFTHADSVDELREEIREAVHCHFERENLPAAIRLRFLRDEVISA
jgi:predicted RNase H-like HicB family nuclease